jgi:hypothetical protein
MPWTHPWWWTSWSLWYRRGIWWKPHGRVLKNTWQVHVSYLRNFLCHILHSLTVTSLHHVFPCFLENLWIFTSTFHYQIFYYSFLWWFLSTSSTHETSHMVFPWRWPLYQYPWYPIWHPSTTTWRVNTLSRSFTIWTKPSNRDHSDSSHSIRWLEERNIQSLPCPTILWNDNSQSFDKKWFGRHQTVVYRLVPPSSNCNDHSKTLQNPNTTIITTKLVFPWSIHLPTY